MTANTEDRIQIVKKSLIDSMCGLLEDVVLLTTSNSFGYSGDPDELKCRFIGSVSNCVDSIDELMKLRIKQSREE